MNWKKNISIFIKYQNMTWHEKKLWHDTKKINIIQIHKLLNLLTLIQNDINKNYLCKIHILKNVKSSSEWAFLEVKPLLGSKRITVGTANRTCIYQIIFCWRHHKWKLKMEKVPLFPPYMHLSERPPHDLPWPYSDFLSHHQCLSL